MWRRELRHEVVFGAEAAQGTQLPFPPELLSVLAKATNFYIAIHILCFSFSGGRGQLPKACDSNLRSLSHLEYVFWGGDDDYWAVLQFMTL